MIKFRQNAMNKIASAEDLDKTIVIVGAKSWASIITIAVLAVLFLIWSVFAKIASHVSAPGIFLPFDGIIVNITSVNSGEIEDIFVNVGDIIEKDGLVAELSASANKRRLKNASDKLESENALYERIANNVNRRKASRQDIRKEQLERVDEQIEFLRNEVQNNKQILDERLVSFQQQTITRNSLAAARNNYFAARQQLDNLLSNKAEQLYSDVQTEQQDEIRLEQIKQNIRSLENEVEELEKSLLHTKIYTPIAGRIIEIQNIQGTNIVSGQTIANVVSSQSQYYARAEKNMEFIAYINIAHGKKVKIGSKAQVAVEGLDKNSFGFIKGIVIDISNFPVSGAGILSKLGNRSLVEDFTKKGSVYEVRVRLLHSSEAKNNLLWSTDNGSEVDSIEIGTLGTAEFVLEETAPITKAIPALERFFN